MLIFLMLQNLANYENTDIFLAKRAQGETKAAKQTESHQIRAGPWVSF